MANSTMTKEGASIRTLFDHFGRLARDGMATLVAPWLAIAVLDFGFVAIAIATVALFTTAEPGIAVQLIGAVQVIAIMTLRVALLKTLRDVAFHGPSAVESLGAVGRDILERLGPAFAITVATGVIVSIGLVLCVLPGLVALFFFAFAPYLVVTHGMNVVDALRESARWARREWLLLLTALFIAIVVVGVWAVIAGGLTATGVAADVGVSLGMIGVWFVNTIIGYIVFLWWGAVYVSADSRRQVDTLRKTAPSGPPSGPPAPKAEAPEGEQRPDTAERSEAEMPESDEDLGSADAGQADTYPGTPKMPELEMPEPEMPEPEMPEPEMPEPEGSEEPEMPEPEMPEPEGSEEPEMPEPEDTEESDDGHSRKKPSDSEDDDQEPSSPSGGGDS